MISKWLRSTDYLNSLSQRIWFLNSSAETELRRRNSRCNKTLVEAIILTPTGRLDGIVFAAIYDWTLRFALPA